MKNIKFIPNSVCWNITSRCNETCKFCYRETNMKDLTFEEQKKVIDILASVGILKLTFAGGEPLLIPRINDLILYAKSKGLVVSMTSNAILIDEKQLNFLLENLDWLTLSLDGATDEIQTLMTRHSKHATKVREILEYASAYKKGKCRIKINTVVSKKNYKNVQDIADLVKKYNVTRWKLMQFTPLRSYAKEAQGEFEIRNDEFVIAYNKAKLAMGSKVNRVEATCSDDIEQETFTVFPNGDVRVAKNHQEKTIGNLLQDSTDKIWARDGREYKQLNMRTKFLERNIDLIAC